MFLTSNKGKFTHWFWAVPTLLLVLLLANGCTGVPDRNPTAVLELGTYLFSDPRLSGDGSISCATCHKSEFGYGDGQDLSETYPASDGFRNTPTIVHASSSTSFYADGRLSNSTPSDVIRDMIGGKLFLNVHDVLLTERMKQIPVYDSLFYAAFGSEPTFDHLVTALEHFQASLTPKDSPYETGMMSASALRGEALFQGSAGCASCHSGPTFSDGQAHAIGVPNNASIATDPLRLSALRLFLKEKGVDDFMTIDSDPGRYVVTGEESDYGAFMTPSLRQVADTAPYMHNGLLGTLEEVVAFYSDRGPALSETEQSDVVEFLKALSGKIPEVFVPEMPDYAVSPNWSEEAN